uniref:(northern house mosquito) hypothetical protein n=1 Tax=Culex pipiens TaxID=7175 RepID=A0A8D8BX43_CULPI
MRTSRSKGSGSYGFNYRASGATGSHPTCSPGRTVRPRNKVSVTSGQAKSGLPSSKQSTEHCAYTHPRYFRCQVPVSNPSSRGYTATTRDSASSRGRLFARTRGSTTVLVSAITSLGESTNYHIHTRRRRGLGNQSSTAETQQRGARLRSMGSGYNEIRLAEQGLSRHTSSGRAAFQ